MSKLAILGGEPIIKDNQCKYVWPEITNKTKLITLNQLDESISIYNKSGIIAKLEDKFSRIHNIKHSLLFNSGTSALHSIYVSSNFKPDDEVICPAYTFYATVTPIFNTGAIPILVDCDENGNIDPDEIEKKITDKTKAVMITHMWGVPCNMDKIQEITRKNKLLLFEDFSHAHFAKYQNQFVGSFGDVSACSIQGQKTLTGGEGGILITNSDEHYYRSLLFGHYNKRCVQEIPKEHPLKRFSITGMGLKQRIHPVSAAIADEQIDTIFNKIEIRRKFAKKLIKELEGVKGIRIPKIDSHIEPSWYAFIFQYIPEELDGLPKKLFYKALVSEGCLDLDIPNSTCPLNLLPLFQNPKDLYPSYENKIKYAMGDFPNAEKFYQNILKIPVWSNECDLSIIQKYIGAIKKVSENYRDLIEYLKEGIKMKELKEEEQNDFLNELLTLARNEDIEKVVVGAVIKNGERVLLLERPKDDFMGGINELPSGNMEKGETIRDSLIREVKEETNLDLRSFLKYLGSFDYLSGSGKKVRQYNFLIDVIENGEIKLTEHDNFIWAEKENDAFKKVTDSVKEILDKI
jgi:perosamine synthetase